MEKRHSLRSLLFLVAVGVAVGLLVELLTPSVSWIASAWSWSAAVLEAGWRAAGEAISVFGRWLSRSDPRPNWLWSGLWIVSAIALMIGSRGLIRRQRSRSFRSYTNGTFGNVVWRWKYWKHEPIRLEPFCPECDMAITYWEGSRGVSRNSLLFEDVVELYCERCGGQPKYAAKGSYKDLLAEVSRRIERNVRTGEWKEKTDELSVI